MSGQTSARLGRRQFLTEPAFASEPLCCPPRSTSLVISKQSTSSTSLPLPLTQTTSLTREHLVTAPKRRLRANTPRYNHGSWQVGYVMLRFCAPQMMTALRLATTDTVANHCEQMTRSLAPTPALPPPLSPAAESSTMRRKTMCVSPCPTPAQSLPRHTARSTDTHHRS
jgi:hypothetical protein